jgi:hypothetical protein
MNYKMSYIDNTTNMFSGVNYNYSHAMAQSTVKITEYCTAQSVLFTLKLVDVSIMYSRFVGENYMMLILFYMLFYIILLRIKVSGLLSIISSKSKEYYRKNVDQNKVITSVYNTLTSENDRMKEKLDDIDEEMKQKLDDIEEMKQKLHNIEEILVDECYNDEKSLSYTGDVWTMNLLKEKALQIGIPINNRLSSIAYVIRVAEQIQRISDIVGQKYNEEQETYGMHIDNILDDETEYSTEYESEGYTSDSEWLP